MIELNKPAYPMVYNIYHGINWFIGLTILFVGVD